MRAAFFGGGGGIRDTELTGTGSWGESRATAPNGGKIERDSDFMLPNKESDLNDYYKKIDALHTFTVAVPSDVKQLVSRRQTLLDSTAGSSQRGKKKPKRLSKGFSCISREVGRR